MKKGLAGSMIWNFYDNGVLVATANSLTDSGINATASKDAVRGGKGHKLLFNYFYETGFTGNLTDPIFDLNYFKHKWGTDITAGGTKQTVEGVITSVANEITVTGTPAYMPNTTDLVGEYKLASSTSDDWTAITFVGQTASVSGLASGTQVCVRYFADDSSARTLIVPTNMIPDTLYAVGIADQFKASNSGEIDSSSSKIGELQVIVPKAQFDPNADLALTSSGHANTSLGFEALANTQIGCDAKDFYAILTETRTDGDATANLTAIMVADGDKELAVAENETLVVYGVYNDGTSTSPLDPSLLTFTSLTPSVATVGENTGVLTGVLAGDSVIEVVVTGKTSVSTNCSVTVV